MEEKWVERAVNIGDRFKDRDPRQKGRMLVVERVPSVGPPYDFEAKFLLKNAVSGRTTSIKYSTLVEKFERIG